MPRSSYNTSNGALSAMLILACGWTILQFVRFPRVSVIPSETDAFLPSVLHRGKSNNRASEKSANRSVVDDVHSHFHVPFPLCLVHVGKTAGSSVSCSLGLTYANCEGMPRDKISNIYFFHMRRNTCPHDTATYLVTLRNPVQRILSWFEFERTILPTRKNQQEEQMLRWKRSLLFVECYSNMSALATHGLQPLREVKATKPPNMTCPERAWAAITGARAFSYHEWYNYEHYWNALYEKRQMLSKNNNSTARLVVLRTEHIDEDWASITSSEPLHRHVNRGPKSQNGLRASTTRANPFQQWPTTAKENLCRALCDEMQRYKNFLKRAENLNADQVIGSIQELQQDCPDETMEERRCIGIPAFPPIKVAKRQFQVETKKRFFISYPVRKNGTAK